MTVSFMKELPLSTSMPRTGQSGCQSIASRPCTKDRSLGIRDTSLVHPVQMSVTIRIWMKDPDRFLHSEPPGLFPRSRAKGGSSR